MFEGCSMSDSLPDFDLDRYLPYRFAVIATRLSNELSTQYREKYGISIAEWRVLVNLAYSDSTSVRDIEKRVSMEKSKVSRAVSRLQESGYLTKEIDSNDRRLLQLELTPKGAKLVGDLVPLAQAYQRQLEAQLMDKVPGLQTALDELMKDADL
ncbi:DNA-binding MarR family transcriptional regulator [Pelagimonas varians]|uniref:MarR family protein n=2 Tax=Pelagimonas varians TaxID=696760 RepID=A0A238KAY0_9RHOB|nr:DNA-binding MarR family transcriptional regulator [Pelagimonas varians]SMX39604.1 MarR family protein [Pelagimonas varians]